MIEKGLSGNKWDKDVVMGGKAGGTRTHFGKEVRAKGQNIERRIGRVGMFPRTSAHCTDLTILAGAPGNI